MKKRYPAFFLAAACLLAGCGETDESSSQKKSEAESSSVFEESSNDESQTETVTTTTAETTATAETTTSEGKPRPEPVSVLKLPAVYWCDSLYYVLNSSGQGGMYFLDGSRKYFDYEAKDDRLTIDMISEDDIDTHSTVVYEGEGYYTVTYDETGLCEGWGVTNLNADDFIFLSDDEIEGLLRLYIRDTADGYEPQFVEADGFDGNTVNVHVYDIIDDHTATYGWFYINRLTAKGDNFIEEPVDLTPYLENAKG